jgi:glycosyltransferase involved in cell wall biosynthesis
MQVKKEANIPDTKLFEADVLVVTVHKSFWSQNECTIFPRRIIAAWRWGHSENWMNGLHTLLWIAKEIHRKRPKVIFFGIGKTSVKWFCLARRLGLWRDIICIMHNYKLSPANAKYVDRIIAFSTPRIKLWPDYLKKKSAFVAFPGHYADMEWQPNIPRSQNPYIFTGGQSYRDFPTIIEAVRDMDIELKVLAFYPDRVKASVNSIPPNCNIYQSIKTEYYLGVMNECLFVAVPLLKNSHAGITTIVQAMTLGKVVITTAGASVDDYVTDGVDGFLIPEGDIAKVREVMQKLILNPELRQTMEKATLKRAETYTYQGYVNRVQTIVQEVQVEKNQV